MATFAQITDLHLRPPGVLTFGTVDTDQFASAAIAAICERHLDLDAVIVTGDLADLGEEEAYNRAAMLLSRFSVPVLVTPGNHDRTEALREAFVAWPGLAEPQVPHKICHVATFGDATVVTLDTAVDGFERGDNYGELGPEQLAWLDSVLAAAEGPTLIAMHHPPFVTGISFMDGIGLVDADAFARVVGRHPNVKRVVCGHVHRPIIGDVAGVPAVAIPGVAHQIALNLVEGAPGAMIGEPPAYAIHTVTAERTVTHIGYVGSYGGPIPFGDSTGKG